MKRFTSTLAIAAVLTALPIVSLAQVSPGTTLVGQLDQEISSQTAQVGQSFTISGVHSTNYDIHNAVIYGHVASVQRQSQGGAAKIRLAYDKLHTNAGSSYALAATTQGSSVTTKSNALKEAGGAVGGMVIGNILGKAVGTNLGGAAGAAGGYLYAKNNRAPVFLGKGSQVTVNVERATYLGVNR